MFDRIKGLIRSFLDLFHNKTTAEEILGVKTCASDAMLARIELWRSIFMGNAAWNEKAHSAGVAQQIMGVISAVIAREITVDTENEAIKRVMETLDDGVEKIIDYMVITGGCVMRPIVAGGRLQFELLPLGDYLPTHYDYDGTLLGCVIFKQFFSNEHKYLLAEHHEYSNGNYNIECKLFNIDGGSLSPVSLTECEDTQNIDPNITWQGVNMPMVVEFRNNTINTVDGSLTPVSILCGAEDLIRDADLQYERMTWEQEAGAMRVFADKSLLERRETRGGNTVGVKLSPVMNRLMVQLDGDIDGTQKITEHAPGLRTTQQDEMFQEILRRLELACNLGKGTISNMENVEQTATQYSGGRQQFFAIIDKLEDEIEQKYYKCAAIFAYMARAYNLGGGSDKITVSWCDDQTRKDIVQAKQVALQELSAGVLNAWEYRVQFYGEDEATAKANIPQSDLNDGLDDLRGE